MASDHLAGDLCLRACAWLCRWPIEPASDVPELTKSEQGAEAGCQSGAGSVRHSDSRYLDARRAASTAAISWGETSFLTWTGLAVIVSWIDATPGESAVGAISAMGAEARRSAAPCAGMRELERLGVQDDVVAVEQEIEIKGTRAVGDAVKVRSRPKLRSISSRRWRRVWGSSGVSEWRWPRSETWAGPRTADRLGREA